MEYTRIDVQIPWMVHSKQCLGKKILYSTTVVHFWKIKWPRRSNCLCPITAENTSRGRGQTLHLPAGSLTVDTSSERLAQQPPPVLPPTPAPWEFSWVKWLAWFDIQNCTPHCQEHSVKSTDQANLWCKVHNFDDHHAVKQTWEGLPELTVASPWTAARVTSSSTSSIRATNMLSTSAACWTSPCSGTWKFGEDNEASPIFVKLKNLRKILISMHICQ